MDTKGYTEQEVEQMIETAVGDNNYVNMATNLGTARDKNAYGRFVAKPRRSVVELDNIYEASWIAKKIIELPVTDSFRQGWSYGGDVTPEMETMLDDETDNMRVIEVLSEALSLARLHGWAYIFIGVNDGLELKEEMADVREGELAYFSVLRRDQCRPKDDAYKAPSESAGVIREPKAYILGNHGKEVEVHASRIMRIETMSYVKAPDGMPYPVLQQVHETLLHHASVNANTASLVHEAKIDVIRVPDLFGNLKKSVSGVVNKLVERFSAVGMMKSNNGMIVLDKNEEYDSKQYAFGGLADLLREFSVQTAGASGIPYALLYGQAPAGMNATGEFDMRNYYDDITAVQKHRVRKPLTRMLSMICANHGYYAVDLKITFNSLWQIDALVKAQIQDYNSKRDALYMERGIVTEAQVAKQLVSDGTYTTIDEEHIKALEDMEGYDDDPNI